MRIDRYLSTALGISRKDAAVLIKKGAVAIGGVQAKSKDAQAEGLITVNGQAVEYHEHVHIMLNKPAGVLTAARDKNAPTVMQFIDPALVKRGISPVGRLDKDVTGLLIFTTDGELNHRLTSPLRDVPKVYIAKVNGVLTDEDAALMSGGMNLGDFTAKPAKLEILGESSGRLTVTEGKFHQVKRMFDKVGKPVEELRRISVAGVEIDGTETLAEGECRELSEQEVRRLYSVAGIKQGEVAE